MEIQPINCAIELRDFIPLDGSPLKAVIFDLDGTLIDTMPAFADIATDVITRYTTIPAEIARASYLNTSGLPFRSQVELIVPGSGDLDVMSTEYEQRKLMIPGKIEMSDDTVFTLSNLRRHGLGTAISSNNQQANVSKFSEAAPVSFDVALGYRFGFGKGQEHIAQVCRHYNCGPRSLLYVGDSLNDAILARNCGVPFVALTRTFTEARFRTLDDRIPCISELSHLLNLLQINHINV